MINTHNGIPSKNIPPVDIKKFPAVKSHLDYFWDKISAREDKGVTPYNLRSCVYMEDFSKQKIVWGEISDKTKFALDYDGAFFTEATTFYMTGESMKFLLCALNSKVSEWLFSKIGTTTGVGTVCWKKYTIEQLLVPYIPIKETKKFNILVDKIYADGYSETTEMMINSLIYEIYELNEDEIKHIENFASGFA